MGTLYSYPWGYEYEVKYQRCQGGLFCPPRTSQSTQWSAHSICTIFIVNWLQKKPGQHLPAQQPTIQQLSGETLHLTSSPECLLVRGGREAPAGLLLLLVHSQEGWPCVLHTDWRVDWMVLGEVNISPWHLRYLLHFLFISPGLQTRSAHVYVYG